jgi:hypothetical protein
LFSLPIPVVGVTEQLAEHLTKVVVAGLVAFSVTTVSLIAAIM